MHELSQCGVAAEREGNDVRCRQGATLAIGLGWTSRRDTAVDCDQTLVSDSIATRRCEQIRRIFGRLCCAPPELVCAHR